MHSIHDVLAQDHQTCDGMFAETEDAVGRADFAAARDEFARFREAMQRHFSAEEEIVFPAFEGKTGDRSGPTQIMRSEHQMMRDLLVKMDTALAQQQAQQYLGLSETLLILLQQHNIKEENILYPMIDQALGPEQQTILAKLQATGVGRT
jgi:iron-sulfur cluster repair protein YtfE (RIC family)